MAPQPNKPGLGERAAKWFGLQVAAKAVGLAFGLPIVSGAVMSALAWMQGLPLAYGFLAVLISMATVSVILSQSRAFLLSYSVLGKFVLVGGAGETALSSKDEEGYGMMLLFRNDAAIPLQYEVTKYTAHLNGRVVDRTSVGRTTTGGTVAPGDTRHFLLGVAPIGLVPGENLFGEIEIEYVYGRPEKLNHRASASPRLQIVTGASGEVLESRMQS